MAVQTAETICGGFNFRVHDVSAYRPDCLFQTVIGLIPVNHDNLRNYRTDYRQWHWETVPGRRVEPVGRH